MHGADQLVSYMHGPDELVSYMHGPNELDLRNIPELRLPIVGAHREVSAPLAPGN